MCLEDPHILLQAVDISNEDDVLSIVSGGENLVAILLKNPRSLLGIDINIEQIYLVKLKIAAIKIKYNSARKEGENLFVPKGVVEPELVGVAPNSTMNPLAWIDKLTDYFYQSVNMPQIIIGNAKSFTDASGKIVYLAFEQSVKAGQLYLEEQVLLQLNLVINLTFPASLQTDAISDTPSETDQVEEEPIEQAAQTNDTTAELEGKKCVGM